MGYLTTGVTRWGLVAAGVSVAGALIAWGFWGGAIFSPGGLSGARDSVSLGGVQSHMELQSRCGACHPALGTGTPMSARCLDCHSDIAAELRDTASLHGAFEDARPCLSCHTEHRGREGGLTQVGSGVAHDRFGFSLVAHRRTVHGVGFTCRDCHLEGTWRFEAERCLACHRDYQATAIAKHVRAWGEDCRGCHDGTDRFSSGRFDHYTTRFAIAGAHQKASCVGCHPTAKTLADFTAAPADCRGCHEKDDKHRGGYGDNCATCHGTDRWDDARLNGSPEFHESLGFALTAHRKTSAGTPFACRDCHTGGSFRLDSSGCTDCHLSYQSQFVTGHVAAFGSGCLGCHDGKDRYSRGRFSHDSTGMPLANAHQRLECAACHLGARTPADFRKASTECLSCHRSDDKHGGRYGTDCATCHTTRTWKGATFDHGRTTAACVGCHRSDDKHGARYGTDCASCHTTRTWKGATFDHARTTAACVSCHRSDDRHNGGFGTDCAAPATRPEPGRAPGSSTPSRSNHGEGGTIPCKTCHADAPNYKTYTCYGCHEHSRDRILRKHQEERVTRDLDNCVRCHRTGGEHEGEGEDGRGEDDD